ncbi:DUF4244 domain-containing protein [Nonomuraea insulae]|uniref:DUF4244 domain-containing protein n=1 Tax=Nonomuraea insulae TaxID=1616787 RepID=A0ABW1D3M4_9ACTN
MHSPATTPDDIKATPARVPTSSSHIIGSPTLAGRKRTATNTLNEPHQTTKATATGTVNEPCQATEATATGTVNEPRQATEATATRAITPTIPDTHESTPSTPTNQQEAPATPNKHASTPSLAPSRRTRSAWPRYNKWLHYAAVNRERGMSTAEYAVGTIAACAFAALLFKVVSSPEVQEMLTSLINRALNTAKE